VLHPPHHPRLFLVEVQHVWRCSIYPFSSGFYQWMKNSPLPFFSPIADSIPTKHLNRYRPLHSHQRMIRGGRTYAKELDKEGCCPNPLDEYRHQTSETPPHVNRSSPTYFCCSLNKHGWFHGKISCSITKGSGLKSLGGKKWKKTFLRAQTQLLIYTSSR